MQADGRAGCSPRSGLVDGPLPTHYEPHESPFDNPLYAQRSNPAPPAVRGPSNPYNPPGGEPGADVFPYVVTTYRLTEHHTAGGMSRSVPYLAELQPEMFCEVSPELAARARARARRLGDDRHRARGDRGARAGTERMRRSVGSQGATRTRSGCPTTGARAACPPATRPTTCSRMALDPNVHIQEFKAATCDIRPGRRPRGPALRRFVDGCRKEAGA